MEYVEAAQGDYTALWEEVGKEGLPREYGGGAGPVAEIHGGSRNMLI